MVEQNEQAVLAEIKRVIQQYVPGALIILFGSRARGDAGPDSDFDLLVLTPFKLELDTITQVRDPVYQVELRHGAVASLFFYSEEEWHDPQRRAEPLYHEVMNEGIVI